MAAKGKTPAKPPSKTTSKSAAKSNRPRKGAPPPIAISRPKPWGLIAATVAMVLFAGGVIGYAIHQVQAKNGTKPDALASEAAKIQGISVVTIAERNHVQTPVSYPQSPPIGGNHDPQWADCTGTVYANPIRSENAVHALEHGAVWITYQPGIAAAELDSLKKRVDGVNYMMLSPYPGLKSKVSLQSWGHQLFVDSADDPRVDQFVTDLRLNSSTTPEFGASCADPDFKTNPRPPDAATPTTTASPKPSANPSATGSAPTSTAP
ncbi:MAG TPA: DUF3105 domain-containing protein [Mycobacteriales bacterium]|nr:DUF3105 domain-containing protein [Mycobacteriales bacterium]